MAANAVSVTIRVPLEFGRKSDDKTEPSIVNIIAPSTPSLRTLRKISGNRLAASITKIKERVRYLESAMTANGEV